MTKKARRWTILAVVAVAVVGFFGFRYWKARKSALNVRAREGNVLVVEPLAFEKPQTKQLAGLLTRLGAADRKVLLLTAGPSPNVYLSGRNLPQVQVLPFADATAYEVLWAETVVIEMPALAAAETAHA